MGSLATLYSKEREQITCSHVWVFTDSHVASCAKCGKKILASETREQK